MKNKEPTNKEVNKLLKYYQDSSFVNAQKLALSIIQKFPNHQFSWKILFEIYRQQGRLSESLKVIERLLLLEPDDYQYHFYLGNNLRKLNRNKEAQISYKKSIDIKSDFAEAFLNLGIVLQNESKLKEAEKNYRKAIDLNPNFFEAYYNLGNILLKQENAEEAKKNYRKVVELNPNFVNSYLKLGNILQEEGKNKDAEVITLSTLDKGSISKVKAKLLAYVS